MKNFDLETRLVYIEEFLKRNTSKVGLGDGSGLTRLKGAGEIIEILIRNG